MRHYRICEDHAAWRVVDGEAVIVHAETSAYFGLNVTGTALWLSMDAAPLSIQRASTLLVEAFAASPDAATMDVASFLETLLQQGLTQADEAAPGSSPETSVASDQPEGSSYEAPTLSPFGELEQLVLSGE